MPPLRRLPMRPPWPCRFALLLPLVAGLARAAGTVEILAPDATVTQHQRLRLGSADASSSLGASYAPARVCDGDRRTKWVAPIRPTPDAPQWIAVALAEGVQAVSAVAVFGERVDNDGVIDADVQVEADGGFATVATVRGAAGPAWIARFEPVRTTRVRLQVLQSGGPTDHTDVYEVEVFGEPASPAELRTQLGRQWTALEHQLALTSNALHAAAPARPPVLEQEWRGAMAKAAAWAGEQGRWENLDRPALAQTLAAMQAADASLARWRDRLNRRAAGPSAAGLRIERERTEVRSLREAGPPLIRIEPARTVAANRDVALRLDPADLRWSVAWGEGIDAAVSGARFSVEVDGRVIALGTAAAGKRPVSDPLGAGEELVQTWRHGGLRIERTTRIYAAGGVLTLGGALVNEGTAEVRLGTVELLRLGAEGGWTVGSMWEAPAAVFLQGHSLLRSSPFTAGGALDPTLERTYRSSGVLALVGRDPDAALILGYVRADEAAPDLAATFRVDDGGTALSATSRFLGRVLGPGERLELNRVYLAAERDAFRALERYGDALARFSPRPARTGPTSLWCSWYAHRMGMTEEKVLANAAVAARHFQPLGLEIMQLDHGWQRGDVTGDWVVNERFPHGLPWLARELRERHGLRLGVWISPTDVAETSELYRAHPEWLLRGEDGRPRVNWRWYWKPNPDCYELDATHPEAYRAIVDVFRRLTSEGVSYYKIDFIAAAGGEQFVQHDPKATRGWSALGRAMEAIREGAGDAAWIRYCQTPPVLSVGLADSTIGGDDTLDAGIPGRFDVLRDNAVALAAGWWLNDRPYHREVCDMSVRMQGSVEEVRLRAAIMALANCSVSWSDEFCYLPPSRIRLMQQAMPPGNPPMRPLDLFRRDVPSEWHLKVTNAVEAWDVVGLFNFDPHPAVRGVTFAGLGLDPQAEYAVFEFWEGRFLGVCRAGVELSLPGESSRLLSIRRCLGRPQLVGTDMHLLQGWHEVKELAWDGANGVLSGRFQRMPGVSGRAYFLVPEGYAPRFEFPLSPASARLTHVAGPLWMQEIEFAERDASWTIPFETPRPPARKEPTGT